MQSLADPKDEPLRDSIAELPEFADISLEIGEKPQSRSDELLDEALMESFPASDPPASGRME